MQKYSEKKIFEYEHTTDQEKDLIENNKPNCFEPWVVVEKVSDYCQRTGKSRKTIHVGCILNTRQKLQVFHQSHFII